VILFVVGVSAVSSLSSLTLLVGRQARHSACEKPVPRGSVLGTRLAADGVAPDKAAS